MTEMPPYLAVKDEDKNNGQGDNESGSDVDWDLPCSFDKPRHIEPIKGAERVEHSWRVKEKYKTHCVALVLCLNVGVDPPDVVKTQPCARLECWIDPQSLSPSKALESIGHSLQTQYERWQPRARYKQSLDPTSDEVKKLCCSLRRNAKDERVLFHYNGHGVPKPTTQGEIWVFNRAYTQYIPLSMYDLQTWMGAPSLYVYDCSNAGVIVDNFRVFADQHEREYEAQLKTEEGLASGAVQVSYKNCIQLAACAAGQSLPMNPELPADLFTACLTTPVKMAMKWFVLRTRTRVAPQHVHDLIDKIPGQVTDRRTMLGELNWIFTAITDTIAWSSLPADLFQQLFRADLLTASLCRNYLLADRIMRSYNCTPVSSPALPSLARHPLWAAWEHTLDLALAQLPGLVGPAPQDYLHSAFFRDQLTAFQVWLELGGAGDGTGGTRPPPAQLPMVLQVLLSTLHRVRALQLLCRFLALGARAVRAVLNVGIFPYMLKLLQASAPNLRASMVYIWARIVAVDPTCQVDLVNAKGHKYFLSVLQDPTVDSEYRTLAAYVLAGIVDNYPAGQEAALQGSMISICLEQLNDGSASLARWACVALGRLWRGYDAARWAGVRDLAHEKLYPLLLHPHPEVTSPTIQYRYDAARWAGVRDLAHEKLYPLLLHPHPEVTSPTIQYRYDAARWAGVRDLAHEKLYPLLLHPHPEVRAACAFALGSFVAAGGARSEHANALNQQVGITLAARLSLDASTLVRAEILAALQWLVLIFEQYFIAVYIQERERRSEKEGNKKGVRVDPGQDALATGARPITASPRTAALTLPAIGFGSVYMKLYSTLEAMQLEPHPQVSAMAHDIINYIANQVDNVREVETRSSGSSSLPPSPNTQPSPLHEHSRTLPHGPRRQKSGLPHTISEASVAQRDTPRERDSTSSNTSQTYLKKQIVSTQFVEWASSKFSRAEGEGSAEEGDCEGRAHHERLWRRKRNRSLRAEAAAALRNIPEPKMETQMLHQRCPLPVAAVVFHPYEQHTAVAYKDNFMIFDWGSAARMGVGTWNPRWGRITDLVYMNAHANALVCAASHTGRVAVFRPAVLGAEPALLAAWRALDTRRAPAYRPPPAQPLYSLAQLVSDQFSSADERAAHGRTRKTDSDLGSGSSSPSASPGGLSAGAPPTLVRWCARRRSLAVAGHAPDIRLWDAHAELLDSHIDTESESPVSSMWRGSETGRQLVCGFADGGVRAWDERCAAAPLYRLQHHAAPVLHAALRPDLYTLITGCVNGEIRMYDTRKMAVTEVLRAGALNALAVHPTASLLACGSVNQSIHLYDLKGSPLSVIRYNEGFMGARIGPVSCLSFHPLRLAMGVGSKDATASVYLSEGRR